VPPAATIWLVRHGRTAWTGIRYCGRADPALSAAGVADARRLAARLLRHFDEPPRVRTSPARRACSTANEIAAMAGAQQPVVDDGLAEVDVGDAEGLTWPQFRAAHPDLADGVLSGHPIDWPGGESNDALRVRAAAVWQARSAARAGTLVIVSHGFLIRTILEAAGIGARSGAARPEGRIAPASAVGLARVSGRWTAVARVAAR
jgi:ribonuclease H / adenosylcobalamin/alpha-ribazole phosphatase